MLHFRSLSALLLSLNLACGDTEEGPLLGSLTQAIRSGSNASGEVFLGADLLVTETNGSAIPCDQELVDFRVEVSRNGAAGPFQVIDSAKVVRACSSPVQGQLALVMDNSRSLKDQLSELEAAAHTVSETVLGQGGRLSLTRVSTNARVLTPLTDNAEEVSQGIEDMFISNGWTALFDGVRMANQTLAMPSDRSATFDDSEEFCRVGNKNGILVFTDSGENNSGHQEHWSAEYPGDGVDTTLSDLQQLQVNGSTTPIYTVGLGERADNATLAHLSRRTGGQHIAIDSPNDLEGVLDMLAQYGNNAHRICTRLPDHICGSLDVRISHRFDNGLHQIEGSTTQHIELACPERAQGRLATLLLTLNAAELGEQSTLQLMAQTVNWVSPVDAPRVLFVRDDFHHGEFAHDTRALEGLLASAGYTTTLIDEPQHGLPLSALSGYDVVWFSNPGYPMDDIKSYHSLLQFSRAGGGVVLQGDDMSRGHGASFSMFPLTQVSHIDNGEKNCGAYINNGKGGQYNVQFSSDEHPILSGLAGTSFTYGDDIDRVALPSLAQGATREVLAWATTEGARNCEPKPVIIAYTPAPADLDTD